MSHCRGINKELRRGPFGDQQTMEATSVTPAAQINAKKKRKRRERYREYPCAPKTAHWFVHSVADHQTKKKRVKLSTVTKSNAVTTVTTAYVPLHPFRSFSQSRKCDTRWKQSTTNDKHTNTPSARSLGPRGKAPSWHPRGRNFATSRGADHHGALG